MRFTFSAELWLYPGQGGWHFVTVPGEVADQVDEQTRGRRRGFGSAPVTATVGATTWRTSIFPDKRAGSYLLPVKRQVRVAERLSDGDPLLVSIDL